MSKYHLKLPKKIEAAVVGAYQKAERAVVGTYQKIEDGVVGAYKKVEGQFVAAFLEKTEDPVDSTGQPS